MEIKHGTAVSPGVAIGPALVLDTEWFRIPHRSIPAAQVPAEIERLHQALEQAAAEAQESQQAITTRLGAQYGAIIGAHALMLHDPSLCREIEDLIRTQHFAVEYAVSRVIRRYAKALESIEGGTLANRVADLFDVEKRILRRLLGQRREELQHLREPVIVLAHDLTPSETANLNPAFVHAFATEAGGRTSHTAIVAGVLEIPAVVGLGKLLTDVSGGDLVIVDGYHGLLIIDPDEPTLARYRQARDTLRS
jgi:phosphotransferase system enzyme I (PtsI)